MDALAALGRRKRIASLFLLPHCEMSCRFCASEADFSVMTFEQAVELIRGLQARSVRNVVLGGGEPFLWPHDLGRLAEFASGLGFLVQVCTNGVSLPDGFASTSGIDRYILPLESMDPRVHDRLRRHRDGHQRIALARIAELTRARRELTVSTVVTRENIEGLPAIADYLVRAASDGARIHAWHLYRFLSVGRGGSVHGEELTVDAAEFRQACAEIRRTHPGVKLYRRDNMMRSSSVEFFWYEGAELRMGSQSGLSTTATGGAGS